MSAAPASGAAAVFALLRGILRLHRERLPPPMRAMGDTYVISEFRRHLRSKTTEQQWRTFAVEWQRYAAMLGGTADQQDAMAAVAQKRQPAAAGSGGCGGGSGGGTHEQSAQRVASVTAAIATGSADMTEQLLEHLSPDQRRQLIKLQQEALALGAEMLGRNGGDGGASSSGAPSEDGADSKA